jgi:aquaporin Z
MFGKKKLAPLVAEFVGTYALASAVYAMASRTGFPFFGAAAAGLTVAVMILLIGSVSGAHLNPAVTIVLWVRRKVSTSTAVVYIGTQMLAGLVALSVNHFLLDEAIKNMTTKTWDVRIFVAEAIGTFILGFGIAAAQDKAYEGGRLAAAIGTSVFVGVLLASFAAAGALNPAVALGIYAWNASYVTGPVVGALVGFILYDMLFASPAKAKKR